MYVYTHTYIHICMHAKSLQSCLTLYNSMNYSLPGSFVLGILQARTLEWIVISFSNACKWKVKVKSLSRVRLLVTPWTAAHQAPPSMGSSRQEYWSGVPLPSLKESWAPRSWCWERAKAGEGDDRGWDGWMTSLSQWVWVSSGSWWWTGKPGMLQSMGSQRVRHDWATELNWTEQVSLRWTISFSKLAVRCFQLQENYRKLVKKYPEII